MKERGFAARTQLIREQRFARVVAAAAWPGRLRAAIWPHLFARGVLVGSSPGATPTAAGSECAAAAVAIPLEAPVPPLLPATNHDYRGARLGLCLTPAGTGRALGKRVDDDGRAKNAADGTVNKS